MGRTWPSVGIAGDQLRLAALPNAAASPAKRPTLRGHCRMLRTRRHRRSSRMPSNRAGIPRGWSLPFHVIRVLRRCLGPHRGRIEAARGGGGGANAQGRPSRRVRRGPRTSPRGGEALQGHRAMSARCGGNDNGNGGNCHWTTSCNMPQTDGMGAGIDREYALSKLVAAQLARIFDAIHMHIAHVIASMGPR